MRAREKLLKFIRARVKTTKNTPARVHPFGGFWPKFKNFMHAHKNHQKVHSKVCTFLLPPSEGEVAQRRFVHALLCTKQHKMRGAMAPSAGEVPQAWQALLSPWGPKGPLRHRKSE